MRDITDFFKNLFRHDDFRSFWQSGSWTSFHGWFYILSDLLVWSAYLVISSLIIYYLLKKYKTVRFSKLYFLVATFLFACSLVYFVDAIMFWLPVYRLSAFVRFITGVVSWVSVFYFIRVLPEAFSLRLGEEVQTEIEMRNSAEKELTMKNEQLQEAERLAKLGYINWDVKNERIEFSDSVPELLELRPADRLTYKTISELIHKDDAKHLEKVIDTIFIKKFFPNFYCRIITPHKEIKHLLVVGQVILSESGTISVVKGTIQDVTEQRLYIQKIQMQNQRLKDIAWIQSHKVRAPVASILGLVQLFNTGEPHDPINAEVLQGLTEAANNLDEVIKEITAKTENLSIPKDNGEPVE